MDRFHQTTSLVKKSQKKQLKLNQELQIRQAGQHRNIS